MKNNRLRGLDVFRGFAIFLMILFHFSYDLNYFQFIHFNFHEDIFWVYARYVILVMFLFSVGVSLTLTHQPKIKWRKIYKRTLILGVASLLVTLVTYMQFPHRWVYFGILHFILLASWISLIFLPYPRISFLIAIIILIGSYLGLLHTNSLFEILKSPLSLPTDPEDLVIFFPWFSLVLLGISFVGFNLHNSLFNHPILTHNNTVNTALAFTGRHALIIYLIHQPILFGLVMFLWSY